MIKLEEIINNLPTEKQEELKSYLQQKQEEHQKEKQALNDEKKAFNEQKSKDLAEITKLQKQVEIDAENVLFDKHFGGQPEENKKIARELAEARKIKDDKKNYQTILSDVKNELSKFFSPKQEEQIKIKQTNFPKDAQNLVPSVEDKQKLNDYSNDIIGMLNPDLVKQQKRSSK